MRLRFASLVLGCIGALSCRPEQSPALRVSLLHDPALELTQISTTAVLADGTILGPQVRPEVEGAPLAARETLRLVFNERLAGTQVVVKADGLMGGSAQARGEAGAELVAGAEKDIEITLSPVGCGAGCAPGLACVGGACRCTPQSCPEGCCQEEVCRRGELDACGSLGGACARCASGLADTCADGECRCGAGASCQPGQVCLSGACRCTAESCATGCCQGDRCEPGSASAACGAFGQPCAACPPTDTCENGRCAGCAASCSTGCCTGATCRTASLEACGLGGAPCVACPASRADACSAAGECRCGAAASCEAGQRCVGGACVCDATSCPSGCCEDNRCKLRSLTTCGAAGATCTSCGQGADTCTAEGACRCGTEAPCAPGQRCAGGACVCDAASCPSGCCGAAGCILLSTQACAAPGQACVACPADRADTCAGGECRCGAGPSCQAGQACVSGACRCTAESCATGCCQGDRCEPGSAPTACGALGQPCTACPATDSCEGGRCTGCASSCAAGCCSGTTCLTPSLEACGLGGAPCVTCPVGRADACSALGDCRCGAAAPCEPGQRCLGGTCVCDATSCPSGCCEDNHCKLRSLTTCGAAGATCASCGVGADTCSAEGACRCGTEMPCAPGKRCAGGACVCDAASCPSGCCGVAGCVPFSTQACAAPGQACNACPFDRADNCSGSGACRCGSVEACGTGLACVGAACVCRPGTCSGCCSAGACAPGTDKSACGVGGTACVKCLGSKQCVAGRCT